MFANVSASMSVKERISRSDPFISVFGSVSICANPWVELGPSEKVKRTWGGCGVGWITTIEHRSPSPTTGFPPTS
jgi:hypothetical protein